jgi:predicted transcriptional regulator
MTSQTSDTPSDDLLRWSADIVSAYVAQNTLPSQAIGEMIKTVHTALAGLGQAPAAEVEPERRRPAVPISRSVQPDHIVCLEDGRKLKMLKRYLRARYDLSPEEYRRRWGLPPDYPMVAPIYAERRSAFAKQIGLGKGVRRRSS